MENEVRTFANKYKLTHRERDLLECLLRGVVKFNDIAKELKVSPSTVNNHFKNIFQKTGRTSKTEVLSLFIIETSERLKNCRYFKKVPKVLIVDDEPEICDILASALRKRGMKVEAAVDSTSVLETLKSGNFDIVVSDVRMPSLDGFQLLKTVREQFRYHPAFIFVSGFPGDKRIDEILHLGAVGLVSKPIDFDHLFRVAMEQFIEGNHDRNRYMRHYEKIPVYVERKFKLNIENIGYGGVFIPVETEELRKNAAFEVGKSIAFEMQLDEQSAPIFATGDIIWKRDVSTDDLKPGIGVKFVDIKDNDQELIREFVKLNRILSYIPQGRAEKLAG